MCCYSTFVSRQNRQSLLMMVYFSLFVTINAIQEALDAFNDWFQHFHHSVPVSQTCYFGVSEEFFL